MTRENKKLLLKDLSARLPYGVMCYGVTKDMDENDNYIDEAVIGILCELHSYKCCYGLVGLMNECNIESIKPYLRPMSSMTEEQKKEFDQLLELELKAVNDEIDRIQATEFEVDFYNKHHLDWRGLIPKGLAIEVTEENNPYKD